MDVKIVHEKKLAQGPTENDINTGNAYAFRHPESVNIWHRRLAHSHDKGILKATARTREGGVA